MLLGFWIVWIFDFRTKISGFLNDQTSEFLKTEQWFRVSKWLHGWDLDSFPRIRWFSSFSRKKALRLCLLHITSHIQMLQLNTEEYLKPSASRERGCDCDFKISWCLQVGTSDTSALRGAELGRWSADETLNVVFSGNSLHNFWVCIWSEKPELSVKASQQPIILS